MTSLLLYAKLKECPIKRNNIMKKRKKPTPKDVEAEVAKTKETIKKQEEFKDWVENKFKEVMDRFLVDFISLSFNYVSASIPSKDGQVIFTVSPNEKYHQLHVNIYPDSMSMWNNGEKTKLVEGIIHECAHIHTDRLTKLAEDRFSTHSQIRDANENLTEVVAQYVRMLLRKEAPEIFTK